MTGWTDEARQASIEARAGGVKPGSETHHAAIKSAQEPTFREKYGPPVPAGIAARYHSALEKGYVPSRLAAQYHAAFRRSIGKK